VSVNFLSWT